MTLNIVVSVSQDFTTEVMIGPYETTSELSRKVASNS